MLECRCSLIVVSVFLAASVGFTAAIDMSTRVCAVGENTRFVGLSLGSLVALHAKLCSMRAFRAVPVRAHCRSPFFLVN